MKRLKRLVKDSRIVQLDNFIQSSYINPAVEDKDREIANLRCEIDDLKKKYREKCEENRGLKNCIKKFTVDISSYITSETE